MEENKQLALKPETGISTKPEGHFDNQFDIAKLLPSAGTLETTDEQKKILYAPVNEEDVEIRPDGLVYLAWMEYVTRLNQAYGTSWAIIPNGNPLVKDNQVIWGFYLVIKGKLMGYAIGSQEYYPANRTMNWTDACEAAKSNCLMRLCKGLGISLELWKPSFIRAWKAKFAESYSDGNRTLWRKKGTPTAPQPKPSTPPTQTESPESKPVKVGDNQYESIIDVARVGISKSGKVYTIHAVDNHRYTTKKKEVAEAAKMTIGRGKIKIRWEANGQWRNVMTLGDADDKF